MSHTIFTGVAKVMSPELTACSFLDLALICEVNGDLKMAEVAAAKAVQVKRDCQGTDFPEYKKYEEVLVRIKVKLV